MVAHYSVMVAMGVAGILGAIASPAAAVRLTGLSVFSAHGGGGITGERVWDTNAATPFWEAWVSPSGLDAAFLNDPSDRTLDYTLTPGRHELQIFADPGFNYQPSWFPLTGVALFFEAETTQPQIAGMRLMFRTATDNPPATIPIGGMIFTMGDPLGVTSAPGTLSATWDSTTVALTEFQWFESSVWGRDRISPHSPTPNGNPDQIGRLLLTVTDSSDDTDIPEGGSVLGLLTLGALLLCHRRAV